MKGKLIGGMIFMITLLLLGSCGCSDKEYYKQKFKFKNGDFVTHKVSGSKILIIDTLRFNNDCGCQLLNYK
jgi:major membrane immunogen (membrane-anchored lipoprotein)